MAYTTPPLVDSWIVVAQPCCTLLQTMPPGSMLVCWHPRQELTPLQSAHQQTMGTALISLGLPAGLGNALTSLLCQASTGATP